MTSRLVQSWIQLEFNLLSKLANQNDFKISSKGVQLEFNLWSQDASRRDLKSSSSWIQLEFNLYYEILVKL
jgi:hypothetical protein